MYLFQNLPLTQTRSKDPFQIDSTTFHNSPLDHAFHRYPQSLVSTPRPKTNSDQSGSSPSILYVFSLTHPLILKPRVDLNGPHPPRPKPKQIQPTSNGDSISFSLRLPLHSQLKLVPKGGPSGSWVKDC